MITPLPAAQRQVGGRRFVGHCPAQTQRVLQGRRLGFVRPDTDAAAGRPQSSVVDSHDGFQTPAARSVNNANCS